MKDESYWKCIEKEMCIHIPESLIEIVHDTRNHKSWKKMCFRMREGSELLWVDYFCRVDRHLARPTREGAYDTISYQMGVAEETAISGRLIPEDSIIIGRVCRDDWLLLRQSGEVCVKRISELGMPTLEEPWGENPEEGVYPVSPTFDGFVEMLFECPMPR